MPSFKMKPPSFKFPSLKLPFFKRSKKSEDKPINAQPPSSAIGAQPFIPPIAKFDDPSKLGVQPPAVPAKKEKPKGFKLPVVNLSFLKNLKKKPVTPTVTSSQPPTFKSGSAPVSQPALKTAPLKSFKFKGGFAPKGLATSAKAAGLVLVIVVLVIVSMTAMTNYQNLQSKNIELTQLQAELQGWKQQASQLQTENEGVAKQIDQISRDLEERDSRISSLQSQLLETVEDLESARMFTSEIEEVYKKLQAEEDRLIEEIKVIHVERNDARNQLVAIKKTQALETNELTRTVGRLRQRLTLLDRDYRELADKVAGLQAQSSSNVAVLTSTAGPVTIPGLQSPKLAQGFALPANTVELPPIIVRKNRSGMTVSVRGRLVEVNEPHDFVVLDKGGMDGVHLGMTFDIIRGTTQIGKARVIRVRPKLAACDIMRSEMRGTLQVGDRAIQSGMN